MNQHERVAAWLLAENIASRDLLLNRQSNQQLKQVWDHASVEDRQFALEAARALLEPFIRELRLIQEKLMSSLALVEELSLLEEDETITHRHQNPKTKEKERRELSRARESMRNFLRRHGWTRSGSTRKSLGEEGWIDKDRPLGLPKTLEVAFRIQANRTPWDTPGVRRD